MKLLRNPIVTGLLVVVAVGVVIYQVVLPQWQRSHPRRAVSVTALAEALAQLPAPVLPPAIKAETPVLPDAAINSAYAEARFSTWVESPRRDPFYLPDTGRQGKPKAGAEAPSPVAKWKLEAIWNQTGTRLAVINGGVYGVGDELEGYKVLRIEGDEIWLEGPHRKERLGFEMRGPAILPDPTAGPAKQQLGPAMTQNPHPQ